jgi:hypothetical protein
MDTKQKGGSWYVVLAFLLLLVFAKDGETQHRSDEMRELPRIPQQTQGAVPALAAVNLPACYKGIEVPPVVPTYKQYEKLITSALEHQTECFAQAFRACRLMRERTMVWLRTEKLSIYLKILDYHATRAMETQKVHIVPDKEVQRYLSLFEKQMVQCGTASTQGLQVLERTQKALEHRLFWDTMGI